MALKSAQGMKSFHEWPREIMLRKPDALSFAAQGREKETTLSDICSILFFRQWEALHRYANEKGIHIIGDMPIYMATDSADAWTECDLLDPQGPGCGLPAGLFF
jgi:4-alpha-glucanotransferase